MKELAEALVLAEAERMALAAENEALRSDVLAYRLMLEQAVGYLRDCEVALDALSCELQRDHLVVLGAVEDARKRPLQTMDGYLSSMASVTRDALARQVGGIAQRSAGVAAALATIESAQRQASRYTPRRPSGLRLVAPAAEGSAS